jgi:uncharacterized protein (TIGR02466 family)
MQNQFRKDIFSIPIYQGSHENKVFHEKIKQLCYKWKQKPETNALMSDSWGYGKRSDNQAEKDRDGVTTFFSEDLKKVPEWHECVNFICGFSRHMLSESHDMTNINISIGNLWSNFYPKGGYIPQHVHGNCLISGVYYVQAEEGASDIIFTDPAWIAKSMVNLYGEHISEEHQNFPFGGGVNVNVPVEERLLVLFPGWLPHQTLANKSVNDRIILSFNLNFRVQERQ